MRIRFLVRGVTGLTLLLCLYGVSRLNYLLFHSLVEFASICLAWSVFLLVYNSKRFMDNSSMVFLGVAYFFVGCIDFGHTLLYKGMNIIPDASAKFATQFWIAARGLETISLVLFPFFLKRRIKERTTFGIYAVITAFLIASITYWKIFPDCYIEGQGLTLFKTGSEYVICLVLVLSIVLLSHKRDELDRAAFRSLITAQMLTIAAELMFTLYTDVYGFSNMLGHLFKVTSFYFIYLALVRISIERPHATIYRNLGIEKQSLSQDNQNLKFLQELSTFFLRTSNTDLIFNELPKKVSKHFKVPIVALELYDTDKDEMLFVGSTGIGAGNQKRLRIPTNQTISGGVAKSGESFISLDISDHTDYKARQLRALNVKTFICVPMYDEERVTGTFALADNRLNPDLLKASDLLQVLANDLALLIEYHQKESTFKSIIDSSDIGFIQIDTKCRFVRINQSMANAFGTTPIDLIGKSLHKVVPADAERYLNRFHSVVHEKKGLQFDDSFHLSSGTRWYSFDVQPVISILGDIEGVQIVTLDITDKREKAQTLEKTERKMVTLLRSSPLIIFEIDRKGTILQMNRAPEGVSLSEVIGEIMYNFMNPDYQKIVEDKVKQVFETGKPEKYQTIGIGPNRKESFYASNIAPYINEVGEVASAMILTQDISDIKNLELEVIKNEKLLRDMAANYPNSYVSIIERDLTVGFTSGQEFTRQNLDPGQFVGLSIEQVFGDLAPVVKTHYELTFSGEERCFELYINDQHQQYRTVPLKSEDERINRILVVAENISERKRAAQEQRENETRLRELATRLSKVEEVERQKISQELHDRVGQNLTVLNLNLSILLNELPDDVLLKQKHRLSDSLVILEETTAVIRDLLSELRPTVLDDYGLLAAIKWFSDLFARRTNLTVDVNGFMDNTVAISKDCEIALYRITQEAMTNIAKHANANTVDIALKVTDDTIQLKIKDDGKGFSHDSISSLGLGLTAMKERSLSMGGICDIVSETDKGTQVTVEIERNVTEPGDSLHAVNSK